MPGLRPNEIAAAAADRESGVGPASGSIEADRTCLGCGYALRGLPIGSVCPECGLPTSIPEAIDDPLSLMPIPVIVRLKWGCWGAFWCILFALGLTTVLTYNVFPPVAVLGALLALAAFWQFIVRLATPALQLPQGVLRGFSGQGKVRRLTQWLQVGWVIALCALLLDIAITSPTPQANILGPLAMGGGVAGLIGLELMAILFERLSEWTRDPEAQKAFYAFTWGLPPVMIVMAFRPANPIFMLVLSLLAVVVILLLPVGLFILARSVGYSVYHALEHEDRLDRQANRRAKFFRGVVEPYIEAHAGDAEPSPINPQGEVPLDHE